MPIRIRHPKVVSTIQVLFDFTVQDLQQEIYAAGARRYLHRQTVTGLAGPYVLHLD